MDDVRIGLALRAMRQRRGWRQSDLAERAGVSQTLVSLIERGQLVHVSILAVRAVFGALGARVEIDLQSRGGEVDRLLDRRHAAIVEGVIRRLNAAGWNTRAEVSFAKFADRGSVDVLAWNAAAGAVLLVEVKSELNSMEETLRRFHAKIRVAPQIVLDELGWRPTIVGGALVLPESSHARERVATHAATLKSAFPHDGHDLRGWLKSPIGHLSAIWFLPGSDVVAAARRSARRVRVRST